MTPVVFLVAGGLFALAAAAYAEGGATLAEPGGASAFARRAFNDLVGFIAGWATVLDYVIAHLAGGALHPALRDRRVRRCATRSPARAGDGARGGHRAWSSRSSGWSGAPTAHGAASVVWRCST